MDILLNSDHNPHTLNYNIKMRKRDQHLAVDANSHSFLQTFSSKNYSRCILDSTALSLFSKFLCASADKLSKSSKERADPSKDKQKEKEKDKEKEKEKQSDEESIRLIAMIINGLQFNMMEESERHTYSLDDETRLCRAIIEYLVAASPHCIEAGKLKVHEVLQILQPVLKKIQRYPQPNISDLEKKIAGKSNPVSSSYSVPDINSPFLPFLPLNPALPTLPSTFLTSLKSHPNSIETLVSFALATASANRIQDFRRVSTVIGKIDRSKKKGLKQFTQKLSKTDISFVFITEIIELIISEKSFSAQESLSLTLMILEKIMLKPFDPSCLSVLRSLVKLSASFCSNINSALPGLQSFPLKLIQWLYISYRSQKEPSPVLPPSADEQKMLQFMKKISQSRSIGQSEEDDDSHPSHSSDLSKAIENLIEITSNMLANPKIKSQMKQSFQNELAFPEATINQTFRKFIMAFLPPLLPTPPNYLQFSSSLFYSLYLQQIELQIQKLSTNELFTLFQKAYTHLQADPSALNYHYILCYLLVKYSQSKSQIYQFLLRDLENQLKCTQSIKVQSIVNGLMLWLATLDVGLTSRSVKNKVRSIIRNQAVLISKLDLDQLYTVSSKESPFLAMELDIKLPPSFSELIFALNNSLANLPKNNFSLLCSLTLELNELLPSSHSNLPPMLSVIAKLRRFNCLSQYWSLSKVLAQEMDEAAITSFQENKLIVYVLLLKLQKVLAQGKQETDNKAFTRKLQNYLIQANKAYSFEVLMGLYNFRCKKVYPSNKKYLQMLKESQLTKMYSQARADPINLHILVIKSSLSLLDKLSAGQAMEDEAENRSQQKTDISKLSLLFSYDDHKDLFSEKDNQLANAYLQLVLLMNLPEKEHKFAEELIANLSAISPQLITIIGEADLGKIYQFTSSAAQILPFLSSSLLASILPKSQLNSLLFNFLLQLLQVEKQQGKSDIQKYIINSVGEPICKDYTQIVTTRVQTGLALNQKQRSQRLNKEVYFFMSSVLAAYYDANAQAKLLEETLKFLISLDNLSAAASSSYIMQEILNLVCTFPSKLDSTNSLVFSYFLTLEQAYPDSSALSLPSFLTSFLGVTYHYPSHLNFSVLETHPSITKGCTLPWYRCLRCDDKKLICAECRLECHQDHQVVWADFGGKGRCMCRDSSNCKRDLGSNPPKNIFIDGRDLPLPSSLFIDPLRKDQLGSNPPNFVVNLGSGMPPRLLMEGNPFLPPASLNPNSSDSSFLGFNFPQQPLGPPRMGQMPMFPRRQAPFPPPAEVIQRFRPAPHRAYDRMYDDDRYHDNMSSMLFDEEDDEGRDIREQLKKYKESREGERGRRDQREDRERREDPAQFNMSRPNRYQRFFDRQSLQVYMNSNYNKYPGAIAQKNQVPNSLEPVRSSENANGDCPEFIDEKYEYSLSVPASLPALSYPQLPSTPPLLPSLLKLTKNLLETAARQNGSLPNQQGWKAVLEGAALGKIMSYSWKVAGGGSYHVQIRKENPINNVSCVLIKKAVAQNSKYILIASGPQIYVNSKQKIYQLMQESKPSCGLPNMHRHTLTFDIHSLDFSPSQGYPWPFVAAGLHTLQFLTISLDGVIARSNLRYNVNNMYINKIKATKIGIFVGVDKEIRVVGWNGRHFLTIKATESMLIREWSVLQKSDGALLHFVCPNGNIFQTEVSSLDEGKKEFTTKIIDPRKPSRGTGSSVLCKELSEMGRYLLASFKDGFNIFGKLQGQTLEEMTNLTLKGLCPILDQHFILGHVQIVKTAASPKQIFIICTAKRYFPPEMAFHQGYLLAVRIKKDSKPEVQILNEGMMCEWLKVVHLASNTWWVLAMHSDGSLWIYALNKFNKTILDDQIKKCKEQEQEELAEGKKKENKTQGQLDNQLKKEVKLHLTASAIQNLQIYPLPNFREKSELLKPVADYGLSKLSNSYHINLTSGKVPFGITFPAASKVTLPTRSKPISNCLEIGFSTLESLYYWAQGNIKIVWEKESSNITRQSKERERQKHDEEGRLIGGISINKEDLSNQIQIFGKSFEAFKSKHPNLPELFSLPNLPPMELTIHHLSLLLNIFLSAQNPEIDESSVISLCESMRKIMPFVSKQMFDLLKRNIILGMSLVEKKQSKTLQVQDEEYPLRYATERRMEFHYTSIKNQANEAQLDEALDFIIEISRSNQLLGMYYIARFPSFLALLHKKIRKVETEECASRLIEIYCLGYPVLKLKEIPCQWILTAICVLIYEFVQIPSVRSHLFTCLLQSCSLVVSQFLKGVAPFDSAEVQSLPSPLLPAIVAEEAPSGNQMESIYNMYNRGEIDEETLIKMIEEATKLEYLKEQEEKEERVEEQEKNANQNQQEMAIMEEEPKNEAEGLLFDLIEECNDNLIDLVDQNMAKIIVLYVISQVINCQSHLSSDPFLKKCKKFLAELTPNFDNFNRTVILGYLSLYGHIFNHSEDIKRRGQDNIALYRQIKNQIYTRLSKMQLEKVPKLKKPPTLLGSIFSGDKSASSTHISYYLITLLIAPCPPSPTLLALEAYWLLPDPPAHYAHLKDMSSLEEGINSGNLIKIHSIATRNPQIWKECGEYLPWIEEWIREKKSDWQLGLELLAMYYQQA